MKKFKWMMAGESFDAIGGSMMRFHCENFPGVTVTELESRGTAVPGALVIAEDEEES